MGYVFAAICGALLAGAAQIVLEFYKRADDRRGIASAIAGEISGILYGARKKQLPDYFRALVPQLRSPTPPPIPWVIFDTSVEPVPVMNAYIGRFGALGGKLPQRCAHFYTLHAAVRLEVKILAAGMFNAAPAKAADRIENTLKIWDQLEVEGESLITDLQALSGTQPE